MVVAAINGIVKQRKFVADNAEAFKSAFTQYEGKRVTVTVKPLRKTRSTPQNNYYHGVVVKLIAEFIGESQDATHEILKARFNSQIKIVNGHEMPIPQSTAKLSTQEFSVYVERCRHFAATFLGLYIPDPNEVEQ